MSERAVVGVKCLLAVASGRPLSVELFVGPTRAPLAVACAVSAQNKMNCGFTPLRTRRGEQALDATAFSFERVQKVTAAPDTSNFFNRICVNLCSSVAKMSDLPNARLTDCGGNTIS